MASQSFDSKNSTLLVAGIEMSSFGDNKITISRNNDVTEIIEGIEGDNIFAKSGKTLGTISFDLLYGSDYDTLMDNLATTSIAGSSGLFPVAFMDLRNLKQLVTFGRVMTQPDIAIGTTPDSRTWVMVVDSVDMAAAENLSDLWGQVVSHEL